MAATTAKRTRPARKRKPKTGVDRAVTYRLKPTAKQTVVLDELLFHQRQLYNAALEERRGAWRWESRSVTKFDQYGHLKGDRDGFEWLAQFGVGVARGTLVRLDEAFQHFFRRVRAGETPGFPRFKSAGTWDSVQWEGTSGWKLTRTGRGGYGRLYVQGVGHISIKLHCWHEGAEPRKIVVRRRGRRWEATVFWRGVTVEKLEPVGRACGIDRGVAVLAAVADDQGDVKLVENPRHLTRRLAELEAAQQALAACKKTGRRDGGGRRNKAKARVARLHEQVREARKDHLHQLSARLVRDFDLIALEDLKVGNMIRSAKGTVEQPGSNVAAKAGLNRSILDAGWGQLANYITYKAASAGREVVRVRAAHTSTTCARCGHTDAESRTSRDDFACTACGHHAHADANAAEVILAVATGRLTIKAPKKQRTATPSRPGSGHQPAMAGRDAA